MSARQKATRSHGAILFNFAHMQENDVRGWLLEAGQDSSYGESFPHATRVVRDNAQEAAIDIQPADVVNEAKLLELIHEMTHA